MNISTAETEEILECISKGELLSLKALSVDLASLGAVVELACCRAALSDNRNVAMLIDTWSRKLPILAAGIQAMISKRKPQRDDMFAARSFEFLPVSRQNWDDNDHHLFEGRFDAALRNAGFGRTSKALAGAFHEMADNIVQHSGPSTIKPARGIIGYHVADGTMSFAVGDVGRGVFESLRENPAWQHVSDSVEALRAVVTKGASRRIAGGQGEGFKQLFKSLADLNGNIVLRTGDGYMRIWGTPDGRKSENGLVTPFVGLQLTVTCSLKATKRKTSKKEC